MLNSRAERDTREKCTFVWQDRDLLERLRRSVVDYAIVCSTVSADI